MTNFGPEVILIAALCKANRVIGNQGTLPWHLPDDLKRFRELTTGHAIIMGRKTWEYGLKRRSLPNRLNIVVSRTLSYSLPECSIDIPGEPSQTTVQLRLSAEDSISQSSNTHLQTLTEQSINQTTSRCIVPSLQDAFHCSAHHSKVFVIGGATIYAQTLPLADRLELTLVNGIYDGDAFFPNYQSIIQTKFALIQERDYGEFQTQTYVKKYGSCNYASSNAAL